MSMFTSDDEIVSGHLSDSSEEKSDISSEDDSWSDHSDCSPCHVPTNPVYLQAITPLHQLVISALDIEMKRRCHLKTTQKVTVFL